MGWAHPEVRHAGVEKQALWERARFGEIAAIRVVNKETGGDRRVVMTYLIYTMYLEFCDSNRNNLIYNQHFPQIEE